MSYQNPYGTPPPDVSGYPPNPYPAMPPAPSIDKNRLMGLVVMALGVVLIGGYFVLPWYDIDLVKFNEEAIDFIEDTDLIDSDRRADIMEDLEGNSEDDLREQEEDDCSLQAYTAYQVTRNYDCDDEEFDERSDSYDDTRLALEYGLAGMPALGGVIALFGLIMFLAKPNKGLWIIVLLLSFLAAIFPAVWEQAYVYAYQQERLKDRDVSSLAEYEDEYGEERRKEFELSLKSEELVFENAIQVMINSLPGGLLMLVCIAMLFVGSRAPAMPTYPQYPQYPQNPPPYNG